MSQINIRNLSNENEDGAPNIVGVSTFTATSYFVPPKGTTAQRPDNPQGGELRFNTDNASLEYFRGETLNWEQIQMISPDFGGVTDSAFYDSSSYGRTVTTLGYMNHSTAQKKVGGSSIYRGADKSCIHVPDSSDFDWGTNDWTLEMWIRRNAQGGDEWLMAHSDGTGANTSIGLHIWSSATGGTANKPSIRFRQSSSNIDCNGTTALAANTWYHIAGVRDGNTLRIYVNGVQEGTTSISGSPDTSSAPFAMTSLRSTGQEGMAGYFDEIRVSKSCRYTSGTTFTPSTTAFTSDSNTLILIHSDHGIESSEGVGARGIFFDGQTPAETDTIDYITISTLGNAVDFGNGTDGRDEVMCCASRTRGFGGGGYDAGTDDKIDYVTFSSTGNATDFGNLSVARFSAAGLSDQVRGIWAGGATPTYQDVIDYIEMASAGNAVDFGNLGAANYQPAACSSSTRGIIGGGANPSATNTIEYVTIRTTANATNFGDLTVARRGLSSCSNSTRGLFWTGLSNTNTIEYITIASAGNATDFGDTTYTTQEAAACASSTRGIVGGGNPDVNTINYVEIATTGNATDFGDLTEARKRLGSCSNAHGGL